MAVLCKKLWVLEIQDAFQKRMIRDVSVIIKTGRQKEYISCQAVFFCGSSDFSLLLIFKKSLPPSGFKDMYLSVNHNQDRCILGGGYRLHQTEPELRQLFEKHFPAKKLKKDQILVEFIVDHSLCFPSPLAFFVFNFQRRFLKFWNTVSLFLKKKPTTASTL